MKHDEERLEQLLHSRSFQELTSDEKEFVVGALGSEEEFTAMQKMDERLTQEKKSTIHPDKRTLASLMVRMREIHQRASLWQRIGAIRIPAYAALLLLVVATALTLLLRPQPVERIIAGPEVLKVDTVYVTKLDTVFRERVVYTMVRTPQVDTRKQSEIVPAVVPIGVSMKEKDELNKLLVSGSD
jgi:hypothetical protein